MRWILTLLLVAFVIPLFVVDTAAECGRGCKCPTCAARDKAVTNFIYDVTIPWPFRHHAPAVVAVDTDADGVFDTMDRCPGTPRGTVVDEAGCPKDSDGDGVHDGIDKCPDTPKGTRVDNTGCPMTQAEEAMFDTGLFATTDILFDTEKAEIKPGSETVLAEIGTILVDHPQVSVEVGGHTDSEGDDAFNQSLSQQRAQAVMSYLLDRHPDIEKNQLAAKGYGESRPVASNDTADGRAKNRRVEFKVLSK